jgi:hypothetical protein
MRQDFDAMDTRAVMSNLSMRQESSETHVNEASHVRSISTAAIGFSALKDSERRIV